MGTYLSFSDDENAETRYVWVFIHLHTKNYDVTKMLHMVVRCYIIKRDLISIKVRFLDQPLKKAMHPLKIDEILASESFTRWFLRVRKHEGCQRAWGNVKHSHHLWVQKFLRNLIVAVKFWVSQPLISVLTTQTALKDWQNIICRNPLPSQNFEAKRQKQPLSSMSHQ